VTTLDDLELELRKLPGVRATGFAEREDVLLVQIHVGEEETEPALPLQATRIAYRHSDRPVAVELVRWRTRGAPIPAGEAPRAEPATPAPPAPSVPLPPEPATVDLTTPPPSAAPVRAAEEPSPAAGFVTPPATEPAPPQTPTRASTAEPGAGTSDTTATVGRPGTVVVGGGFERRAQGESDRDRVRLLAVLTFPDTDELEVHLTLDGRRTIGRAAASRGLLAAVEATLDALRSFVPDLGYEPAWARTLETSTGEGFLVAAGLMGGDDNAPRHGLASGSSAIEAAARACLQALNRSIPLRLAAVRAAASGN
jgi:hypothetical protein